MSGSLSTSGEGQGARDLPKSGRRMSLLGAMMHSKNLKAQSCRKGVEDGGATYSCQVEEVDERMATGSRLHVDSVLWMGYYLKGGLIVH